MKITLIIILVIIAAIIIFGAYAGMFAKVEISQNTEGGEWLVYEDMTGPYKNSPKIMDKIYKELLEDEKIDTYKGFGIYYDDPKQVKEAKLRSRLGCIIESKDEDKIEMLKKKYQLMQFPNKKYIVSSFPYRTKASVIFSLLKVYPALNKYAEKNNLTGGPVMEIYDIPNKKIYYRMELNQEIPESFN